MRTIKNYRLHSRLITAFLVLAFFQTVSAVQLVTTSPSSFTPPAGGNGDSGLSIVSADGRYVLFASSANNLTLTNNNNSVLPRRSNVFLRDRANHTTTLVSINLAGTGGGNGDSFPTGISTNGQFVLFESSASDLASGDTNNASDIFVRDLIEGVTTLVSVNVNGTSGYGVSSAASSNGVSSGSAITPNGRYVAFSSAATNLVAGDTNNIPDIFVRDLQAGTTTLASVGAITNSNVSSFYFASGSSEPPAITPDGRYVIFYSSATNLIPGIKTGNEVYVRDLQAGNTLWVSTNAVAIYQSVTGGTNVISYNYSISDDGQFVAFEIVTNGGSLGPGVVVRYNLQTGLTDIIHTNAAFSLLHNLAMTPDGRFIAFVANVGASSGIYLWDSQANSNVIVSANWNDATTPATGICDSPIISSNGQFVAFISSATNLTTNILAGGFHVYVRDLQAGATRLLDVDPNNFGVGVNPTTIPTLSADGRIVTFESANLLGDNRQLNYDVFARDTTAGTTDLISAHDPALASQTPDGMSGFTAFSANGNGRYLAFYSDADDLVANDTNGFRDVFVRDLALGLNILVSVNTNGVSGDSISTDPAISGDGRYVAFTSSANDLVAGDTNTLQDVFIRDLQNQTTALVSVNTDGFHSGNGDSFSPQISADGRYILFHSKASNLASGSGPNGIENLLLRDLQTGTSYALSSATSGVGVNSTSMTPDGHYVGFTSQSTFLFVWDSQMTKLIYTNIISGNLPIASISPNGQKIVFVRSILTGAQNATAVDLLAHTNATIFTGGIFASHAGLQFSGDGRFLVYAAEISPGTNQNVYLYDFQAGTNLLLSQSFNSPVAAGGNSDSPTISPDGNFIAYRSFAPNIVSNDFNNVGDLFIYDRSNAATVLASASDTGNFAANSHSLKPVFSGDGQTLFLQSLASDMAGNDFNSGSDLFALDVTSFPGGAGTTTSASVFYVQFSASGGFGQDVQNPLLSWPVASGKTYQVQFKNDLSDPDWQDLPGSILFIGDTAYLADSSPSPDKRFYRIVLSP